MECESFNFYVSSEVCTLAGDQSHKINRAKRIATTNELTERASSVSLFAESTANAICMALLTFPDWKRLSSCP